MKTPGREADDEETKLYTRKDMPSKKTAHIAPNVNDSISSLIADGLGGNANISDLDCCATRLRVTVLNPDVVSENILKKSGAGGVIRKGNGVQIIYGPRVSVIKSQLEDFLEEASVEDIGGKMLDVELNDTSVLDEADITHPKNKPQKSIVLYSHSSGTVVPLEEVEDDAFSSHILGDGVAVEPTEGVLFSPCDGKIESVADTGHAVTILSNDGAEILLHIGIDTVKLKGKYFKAYASDGQNVKKGDLLISFDTDKIRQDGYKTVIPLVISNSDEFSSVKTIAKGTVNAGDKIVKIDR